MVQYQHIIWDWNGTLLNDIGLCVDVMNGMLRKRRMPEIDAKQYREIFDFPVESYYRALGFDFELEPFEILANAYCENYDRRVPECSLHKGAIKALSQFAAAVPQQSILSSCEQVALNEAIERFGLTAQFSEIIGQSNRYAIGKAEAGKALISSSGMPAYQTVLIGDTQHDYEVAQLLGVDCILVANGHQSTRRLEAVCEVVLDSLEQVVAYAA